MKNLNPNPMLNTPIDPTVAKLIEGNIHIKAAYEALLLQEISLMELRAKMNYTQLKMSQTKNKAAKKTVFKDIF